MSDPSDFSTPTSPPPSPSPTVLFHCDYSDWSPSFSIIPTVYLLAFLVGCLGNGLVLWAYLDRAEGRGPRSRDRAASCCFRTTRLNVHSARSFPHRTKENSHQPSVPRQSRSLTDSLIASLALADLCFLVTLPLWAVYTALGYHWPFGQPLCRASSYLTALNMYASVFSLSVLSVERYWVLTGRRHSGHHGARSHTANHRALWILGGVWMLAGVLAIPALLLRSVKEIEPEFEFEDEDEWHPTPTDSGSVFLSCHMDYSMLMEAEMDEMDREKAEVWWAAILSLKSTLIGFLLPLVVLLVCYCSLARLLGRHFGGGGPRPDRGRQRRLLRVIVTLVLAFFLCWLPLHVNKTVSMLLELGLVPYSCSLDQVLLAAHPYVTCLAYLNSCLNPLLYAACDPSFRRKCRGALPAVSCRRGRSGREVMEGKGDGGEEEQKERSSDSPTRTQEETAEERLRVEEEEACREDS